MTRFIAIKGQPGIYDLRDGSLSLAPTGKMNGEDLYSAEGLLEALEYVDDCAIVVAVDRKRTMGVCATFDTATPSDCMRCERVTASFDGGYMCGITGRAVF